MTCVYALNEICSACGALKPLVLFTIERRTQGVRNATAKVIARHVSIQELLADGLNSKGFQFRIDDCAQLFRLVGYCDEDLRSLGCLTEVHERTDSIESNRLENLS